MNQLCCGYKQGDGTIGPNWKCKIHFPLDWMHLQPLPAALSDMVSCTRESTLAFNPSYAHFLANIPTINDTGWHAAIE